MSATIWAYPWDLADEGVDAAVRRIVEDGGLNGISIAVSYHAARCLLPHNPKRKVYFAEDGTIYFRPRARRYGRIKPLVNSLVKRTDVLRGLERAKARYGLQIVAWTVCLHNTAQGMLHPDCVQVNAFGDRYFTSLCPANKHAREYVLAIVSDLVSQYAIDTVELESPEYLGYQHGFHHEKNGIELPAFVELLLGLCFCRACLREAEKDGIDVEAVRSHVKDTVAKFFERPETLGDERSRYEELESVLDGALARFLQMRQRVVSTLFDQIQDEVAASSHLRTKVRMIAASDFARNWESGIDIQSVARKARAVTVLAYFPSPDQVLARAKPYRDNLPAEVKVIVGLRASYPDASTKQNLCEKVRLCRGIGISDFSFYNYGLMRVENLSWIREALG